MNEQNETLARPQAESEAIKKNMDYLVNGLYYMGFPEEGLKNEVIDSIMQGAESFSPKATLEFNNRPFDYSFDFKKSEREGSNIYFWNGYTVTMKDNPERAMKVEVRQNSGFTAKESANLLMGLAVCKEQKNDAGISRPTWYEMDFTKKNEQGQPLTNRYYNNHGFDLEAALSKIPMKFEKGEGVPAWVARALKKGNLPEVTVTHNGKDMNCMLVANPKDRTVDVYSEKGERLMRSEGIDATQQNREAIRQEKAATRSMKQEAVLGSFLKNKAAAPKASTSKTPVQRRAPKTQNNGARGASEGRSRKR